MSNSNLEFRKVKSVGFRYEVTKDGRIVRNATSKKQLKQQLDKDGYYRVNLHYKGKYVVKFIHSLVAEAWIGDRPEGYEVDHIDRVRTNNDVSNLRYVTQSEQMKNRTLTQETYDRCRANCLDWCLENVARPTKITKDGVVMEFRSMTKAAEYIADRTNKTTEHVRSKMKKRRAHIYGYDIEYSECRD